MARKKPQADHVADTRGQGWIGLPRVVADSAAYLDLTTFERAMLSEILAEFNGYNNGEIGISYEKIGDRVRGRTAKSVNNGRIAKAVAVLVDHGLLAEGEPASWAERLTREYRLTFISFGKVPPFKRATNEYLAWTPTEEKIAGNAASPEAPPIGDAGSPEADLAGDTGLPEFPENRSFASAKPTQSGDAALHLIGKPYGGEDAQGNNLIPFPVAAPTCEACGKGFQPASRGQPKRFCSETCRRRAEKKRARERALAQA